jgi:hypothetical protein
VTVSLGSHTEHEAALIGAFVIPDKRVRLVELLSKPKRRKDVLRSLAHFGDLDARFQVPIPPSEQSAAAIEKLLRARGAPADCYVISEDAALDARTMSLSDALRSIVAQGRGSLLSCVPGRLGYYEGESQGDRWLLQRGAA